MDQIKEALSKAKVSLERQPSREHREIPGGLVKNRASPAEKVQTGWTPAQVHLDAKHMAEHRIVSHAMNDPAHIAFNQLRTRVLKAVNDNSWKSLAITSPTPGCGKTMVAVNLAISMARVPRCRTVLIDLDLRKPSVARVLGVRAAGSVGEYYEGNVELRECFVQIGQNLSVGLGHGQLDNASELIQGPRTADLFRDLAASLNPDVIIFDLPPLLASDDAIGFIPHVDAALMVVAAGTSTVAEVDECERQVSGVGRFFGIVLNKADSRLEKYKRYY